MYKALRKKSFSRKVILISVTSWLLLLTRHSVFACNNSNRLIDTTVSSITVISDHGVNRQYMFGAFASHHQQSSIKVYSMSNVKDQGAHCNESETPSKCSGNKCDCCCITSSAINLSISTLTMLPQKHIFKLDLHPKTDYFSTPVLPPPII